MPACPEIQARIKYRAQVRRSDNHQPSHCPQVGDILLIEYPDLDPQVIAYQKLAIVEDRDCDSEYLPYRELTDDGSPTKFTAALGLAVWHVICLAE